MRRKVFAGGAGSRPVIGSFAQALVSQQKLAATTDICEILEVLGVNLSAVWGSIILLENAT